MVYFEPFKNIMRKKTSLFIWKEDAISSLVFQVEKLALVRAITSFEKMRGQVKPTATIKLRSALGCEKKGA